MQSYHILVFHTKVWNLEGYEENKSEYLKLNQKYSTAECGMIVHIYQRQAAGRWMHLKIHQAPIFYDCISFVTRFALKITRAVYIGKLYAGQHFLFKSNIHIFNDQYLRSCWHFEDCPVINRCCSFTFFNREPMSRELHLLKVRCSCLHLFSFPYNVCIDFNYMCWYKCSDDLLRYKTYLFQMNL